MRTIALLWGIFLFLVAAPSAHALEATASPDRWQERAGDYLVVDVASNRGYLFHQNDPAPLAFDVATGQKNYVYYIGLHYYAATPIDDWVVKSWKTKGDHITFGPTGMFFALQRNGKVTNYGIHAYAYEKILGTYGSMGCIIVPEPILHIIKRTYDNNGQELRVKTIAGMGTYTDPAAGWEAWEMQ